LFFWYKEKSFGIKKKSFGMEKKSGKEIGESLVREIHGNTLSALQNAEKQNLNVNVFVSRHKANLPPNIMLMQSFAKLASIHMKPGTLRVLFYLFGISGWENIVGIDQKTLSEELKLTPKTISTAMKELTDVNILLVFKNQSDNRRNDYFINPVAAWKGNSSALQKRITKLHKDKTQYSLPWATPIEN